MDNRKLGNSFEVQIVKMGGTIEFNDSDYDFLNNKLLKLDASIDKYFENIIKPYFSASIMDYLNKDSRDITAEDRESLFKFIDKSPYCNILITHGTFSMTETARYLNSKDIQKKVIITGAMIPLVGFPASDAGFNLGFAIGSFNTFDHGVKVAMNGRLFDPDAVIKNAEIFRFEETGP
jgi:L-asparaginase